MVVLSIVCIYCGLQPNPPYTLQKSILLLSRVKLFTGDMYRLFNVLCWLWNIYEGAELLSVYFITNTKYCITYLALTQLFPVLVSHPEMYTL